MRSILPVPSIRKSVGAAPAPCPRMAETYAFRVFGCTARSVIVISCAPVPSRAASFSLIASRPFAPAAPPLACAPRSRATIFAPWLSAANSVPSGPNASGPIDAIVGPWPATATARADEGAQDATTTSATKSQNFVCECMK